jgi:hypothetical protein
MEDNNNSMLLRERALYDSNVLQSGLETQPIYTIRTQIQAMSTKQASNRTVAVETPCRQASRRAEVDDKFSTPG